MDEPSEDNDEWVSCELVYVSRASPSLHEETMSSQVVYIINCIALKVG